MMTVTVVFTVGMSLTESSQKTVAFTVGMTLHRRRLPLLWEWIITEDSCLYCRMNLQEMTGVLIVGMNLHERHLPSQLECIFTADSCIHCGNEPSPKTFALTV